MLQWVKDNRGKILVLLVIKVAFLLWVPLTHADTSLITMYASSTNANYVCTSLPHEDYVSGYGPSYQWLDTDQSAVGTWTVAGATGGQMTAGGSSASGDSPLCTNFSAVTDGQPYYLTVNFRANYPVAGTHTMFFQSDAVSRNASGTITGLSIPTTTATNTRIVSFTPEDNSTTTSPVTFDLHAYINEDDIGTFSGVNITLHNIDQNILFFDFLSRNDIYLLQDRNIQTSGDYYFSSSTALDDGNYRIEACISRSYLGGFILNPFSDVSECVSHQFVVGTSTFIGNISQGLWGETNDFYSGLTATSSEALARTCNPLDGNFGVRECLAFLFVPDASSMGDTFDDLKSAVLMKFPWGYATRFVTILTSSPTTTLPAFSVTLRTGAGSDVSLRSDTITFDPGDMIAGGGALLESIEDPIYGMTLRDVAEPMVQFTFAIALLLVIVNDIMKMGHNDREGGKSREGSKLS